MVRISTTAEGAMPQTNSLDFSTPAAGEKSLKTISQQFGRAGQPVVTSEFSPKPKRTSDTTYREAYVTFASGQQLTLRVNTTGDIYQVLINNAVKPLKEQADTAKAIAEIAGLVTKNQAAFQKAQARKKVTIPKGMTTPKPKVLDALAQQNAELDTQIADRQTRLAALSEQLGQTKMLDAAEQSDVMSLASTYVAARELIAAAGVMLDDATTVDALAHLQIGLDVVETNGPISLEEGNLDQARLQLRMAKSFRAAMAMLDSAKARPMDDAALAQLVMIAKADAASEDEVADQEALATLLAAGVVDVLEGIYFVSEKGRQYLNDNGMDAYGEPFGE